MSDLRTRYLNARAIIKEAIKYYDDHELLQDGSYYDLDKGCACILGSLMLGREAIPELRTGSPYQTRSEELDLATTLVIRQYTGEEKKKRPYVDGITWWNDRYATKAQVVGLLKRTLRNSASLLNTEYAHG